MKVNKKLLRACKAALRECNRQYKLTGVFPPPTRTLHEAIKAAEPNPELERKLERARCELRELGDE